MQNQRLPFIPGLAALILLLAACAPGPEKTGIGWKPVPGRIMTRWAADVSPERARPEYPRPQMQREEWLNLNGLWEYAVRPREEGAPERYDGHILVPFPVESALSGVKERVGGENRLWYRRSFRTPKAWTGKKILLHFEAVDWEAVLWVNGKEIGIHRGGYDPFAFDITDALRKKGRQEIVLSVWDPTDQGAQPRGKQVETPRGIWYTPVTGIWGTAWLEPVNRVHISSLSLEPDIDAGMIRITPRCPVETPGHTVEVEVEEEETVVARGRAPAGDTITVALEHPKLWSPGSPFLYRATVRMMDDRGEVVDRIRTYFGMRKISLGEVDGVRRIFLNNAPLFLLGPLDQGWWPDGLYTAPTDEALRYDLEVTKKLGFNMLRKHVKVEPRRFYSWCDELGLVVIQDMPNGDAHIGRKGADLERSPESARQFELELERMIHTLKNHPCIVMWVAFNEGWGQFDTARIVERIRQLDPTRLVDAASGWSDRGVGDVHDIHAYPGPDSPPPGMQRAALLGEFGGLGLPVKEHTWQEEKSWGYRKFENAGDLLKAYRDLIQALKPLVENGLSAAVYTQTTDVETEVNGLMTYDRAVIKMAEDEVAALNRDLIRKGSADASGNTREDKD